MVMVGHMREPDAPASLSPVFHPVIHLFLACFSPVISWTVWINALLDQRLEKNRENRANGLLKMKILQHDQALAGRQNRCVTASGRFFVAEKVNSRLAALAETGREK